jgi:dTDP-4-amino-4,6-dideoxygalactose transaminase
MKIPIMKPQLPTIDKLKPLFERIDQTNIYSNYGPVSWDLRLAYSKYLGVDPELIIPIANATLAIQGCLEILEQKNWLIPDYTFAATAHAAINSRKNLLILDVNLENYQAKIPENLNPDEFGIIPVMPFGAPVTFHDWCEFDSLIIDAAASLGAPPPDFTEMPLNTMVVYSLHATKVLGAGEGALVVCENIHLANKLRVWSNFGFDGIRSASTVGTNAKMSEYACAIALASILDLDEEKSEWERPLQEIRNLQLPDRYRTIVDSYPGFRPYWLIQLENLHQKEMMVKHLEENEIESRGWWGSPISKMPAFIHLNKSSETPNSQHLADTHLGLPIWKGITKSQLQSIAQCVREFQIPK